MSPACLLEGGGETQHLVTRHSVNPTPRRACGYQECQTYCACAMCFPWTSGSQATAMSRSLVPRPTSVSLCFRSFSMSPSLTVPAGSVKGWVVGGLSETYLMLRISYRQLSGSHLTGRLLLLKFKLLLLLCYYVCVFLYVYLFVRRHRHVN